MKKVFAFALMVIALAVSCKKSPETVTWLQGGYEEALNIAGSKLIMLDFYTDT